MPSSFSDLKTATILSGASLSSAIDLGGVRLFGISMPATWTAAALTVLASFDGGTTWLDIYDGNIATGGSEYVLAAGASRYVVVDPTAFAAIPMLKLRSGTSAAPVAQAGDRAIRLVLRSY